MSKHSIYLSDEMSAFVRNTLTGGEGISPYLQRLILKDIYESGLLEIYKQHVLTHAADSLDFELRDALSYRKDNE